MKKYVLISFVALAFTLFACKNSGKGKKTDADSLLTTDSLNSGMNERDKVDPVRDSILLAMTKNIMTDLKNRNLDSLVAMVDPQRGIRFSPHAFVDTSKDQVIHPSTLLNWKDKKKQTLIQWGENDATGDPIRLTLDRYIKQYVYDADYLKADSLKVNQFIGGGNTRNNLLTIYPDCHFTESYFKGFDKKYEGMDWSSLRLVFKRSGDKYFLVAIVHDQWSI